VVVVTEVGETIPPGVFAIAPDGSADRGLGEERLGDRVVEADPVGPTEARMP